MISLISLSVALLQTPVTFSCRATAMPAVLAAVGKLAGVRMVAKGAAAAEVVYLQVDQLPLDSLMRKIAFVTSCEWVKAGDSYTLEPAEGVRAKEATADLLARGLALRKAVEEGLTPDTRPSHEVSNEIPWMKSIRKIVSRMDLDELAALPQDEKFAFVTNDPTSNQQLLPNECAEMISDMTAEYNKTRDEESQLAPAAKSILFVHSMGFGIEVEVRSFDGKGVRGFDGGIEIIPRDPEKVAIPATQSGVGLAPFQLSSDSVVICQRRRAWEDSKTLPVRLSPDQKARFMDLVQFDPLSFVVSDLLDCYRANGHPQIVAEVPDEMILPSTQVAMQGAAGGEGSRKAVDLIENGSLVTVSSENSVTLLKPVHPADSRASRADRSGVEELLKDYEDHGFPTLEELSAYAVNHVSIAWTPVWSQSLELLGVKLTNSLTQYGNIYDSSWPILQFFGSLSPTQQGALESGGRLDCSNLTPIQSQFADNMLTSPAMEFFFNDASGKQVAETLAAEPTEMLPLRRAGSFFTSTAESIPVLLIDGDDPLWGGFVGKAEEYGELKYGVSQQIADGLTTWFPSMGRMGVARLLSLSLQTGDRLSVGLRLNDVQVPPQSPLISVNQLPEAFLAKANAQARQDVGTPKTRAPASP